MPTHSWSGPADVAIIGGGILGCALAYLLAIDGARVVLLERDQVNSHASGQNAGSLHFQLEYRMISNGEHAARQAAVAMPLHLDAAHRWAELARDVPGLEVAQDGGFMVAHDARTAELLLDKAALEQQYGLAVELLDGPAAQRRAPYLSDDMIAASFCAVEGRADARTAAPALARAAMAQGARIRTRMPVQAIDRDGRHWKLQTPAGSVRASQLVLAAGVWTAELGKMLGARLAVEILAMIMTVTTRARAFMPHLVQHAGTRLSLKQTAEGNVLIGGGWPARLHTDDDGNAQLHRKPTVVGSSVAQNMRAAVASVPAIAALTALRTWVGATTVAPDQLPLVGPVPGATGVYVATGGSAFTLGPTFAQALRRLVQGQASELDLTPYYPSRFM